MRSSPNWAANDAIHRGSKVRLPRQCGRGEVREIRYGVVWPAVTQVLVKIRASQISGRLSCRRGHVTLDHAPRLAVTGMGAGTIETCGGLTVAGPAREVGVSPDAVRYYERFGLLPGLPQQALPELGAAGLPQATRQGRIDAHVRRLVDELVPATDRFS
jgi:hypothetical protein